MYVHTVHRSEFDSLLLVILPSFLISVANRIQKEITTMCILYIHTVEQIRYGFTPEKKRSDSAGTVLYQLDKIWDNTFAFPRTALGLVLALAFSSIQIAHDDPQERARAVNLGYLAHPPLAEEDTPRAQGTYGTNPLGAVGTPAGFPTLPALASCRVERHGMLRRRR